MMIPKSINIFGHKFDVNVMRLDDKQGYVDLEECIIYLNSVMKESLQKETLQHEIFEVIKYYLELSIEHRDLQALSSAFYGVRKDNKL